MKNIRSKHGPEWGIQRNLMRFLRERGWLVERTHGNLFQQGFPDLYVSHKQFGQRWIDVKNPGSYRYTKAQCQKWPVWDAFGIGIWIIVGANETEYDKLFKTPNWRDYWKPSYDKYLIDPSVLIAELIAAEEEEDKVTVETSNGKPVAKGMKGQRALTGLPIGDNDMSWLEALKPKGKSDDEDTN
jgi:hypothetical protein